MADEIERLWRDDRFDRLPHYDKRMHRAQVLTAQIMRLADPYICSHGESNGHRRFYDELMKLFWNGGFDVLTDADRAEAGLPIRGRNGWTEDELQAFERYKLEAMMRPLTVTVPKT
jgi:hypothetical protein